MVNFLQPALRQGVRRVPRHTIETDPRMTVWARVRGGCFVHAKVQTQITVSRIHESKLKQ